jgi:hypothetical protein
MDEARMGLMIEDGRRLLRRGEIVCVPEVTVVWFHYHTADSRTAYSRTGHAYSPAWKVSFDTKEARYVPDSSDRPTSVFSTTEQFARWTLDLDSYGGLWNARCCLDCAHSYVLRDAIIEQREREALASLGMKKQR